MPLPAPRRLGSLPGRPLGLLAGLGLPGGVPASWEAFRILGCRFRLPGGWEASQDALSASQEGLVASQDASQASWDAASWDASCASWEAVSCDLASLGGFGLWRLVVWS